MLKKNTRTERKRVANKTHEERERGKLASNAPEISREKKNTKQRNVFVYATYEH